jgi:DNA-binding NtrC family response regulator/pSer/pThr/pTyr-binding forkhead associated (FHA) protein
MAQLVFTRGYDSVFRVRLQSNSTKIGRSDLCDVVLDDQEISREHAVVFSVEGQFLLRKLGKSPLLINGKEIQSQSLKDGDRIQLGRWEALFSIHHPKNRNEEKTQITESGEGNTQAVALRSQGLIVQELVLHIQESAKPPRYFPLQSEIVTLGASEKNDIVIDDPYISSRHLKIVQREGRVQLFDLGSTNGTWVNGVKVREAELEVGCSIKMGQCEATLISEEKIQSLVAVKTDQFCGLLGSSVVMQDLYGLLQRVGPTEAPVLILGESGTGKEIVARALHSLSSRVKKPFVAINCGAISPELMESELFGHEKGAFTGAERRHDGAFGQARGGTLFLDEIGELPLGLQPKLLRVLENKTYRRIGGAEELRSEVRIIAATHRDLAAAVQENRFREDLFFRLFVLPIHLPPLRERKEDIPLLVRSFLEEFSTSSTAKVLSPAAMARLMEHPYSGNVRELRNVLLRSMILSPGNKIDAQDLSFPQDFNKYSPRSQSLSSPLERLEDMEKRLILKALTTHNWNKARAAEALGIAKSTLFSKIKLYQLQDQECIEDLD